LARTGFDAWQQGGLDDAENALTQLLDHARATVDRDALFHALHLLACVAFSAGDYPRSRHLHEQVLEMSREIDFQGGIGSSYLDIAMIDRAEGDVDSARRRYQQSRLAFEQGGYRWRLPIVDAALAGLNRG
jgi:Tetratricopeptide repeat